MKLVALIPVLLLLIIVLSGCGVAGSPTPEEAALRGQGLPPNQVQILATRTFGDITIVMYSSVAPAGAGLQPVENVGYTIVRRSLFGWEPGNSAGTGSPAPLSPAQVLQVGGLTTQQAGADRNIYYGRALDPTVAVVELIFTDGHTARDEVTNSAFVFVMPGSAEVCSVRALDAQGQELPLPAEVTIPLPGCQ